MGSIGWDAVDLHTGLLEFASNLFAALRRWRVPCMLAAALLLASCGVYCTIKAWHRCSLHDENEGISRAK